MKKTNNKPAFEVADIFRMYGKEYEERNPMLIEQRIVMDKTTNCRTAALGGHIYMCEDCGLKNNAYNSCGDRHCPKCQTLAKEQWLNNRKAELLPMGYFHVVFTLPHMLNPVILTNKKVTLDILFNAVHQTLAAFAADPQWRLNGELGVIAVLHTWTQVLLDHFHLHCLIPAGALSCDRKSWTPARKKFLFRTSSLGKEFRKRYLEKLEDAYCAGELIFPGKTAELEMEELFFGLTAKTRLQDWVVYAKRPFAGPEQVLEYLGRYTHRVAISNNRIQSIDNGKIVFSYRDRQDENKKKTMPLVAHEFIRRFLLHVLPKRFTKIRYFGFLSHRNKKKNIALVRKLLDTVSEQYETIKETAREIMLRLTGVDIHRCLKCNGQLIIDDELPRQPYYWERVDNLRLSPG